MECYQEKPSGANGIRNINQAYMTTPTYPLVSVIVPMHNAQDYIQETLASIIDSSYRPIEVIVMDDGSQDDSLAIARQFAKSHPECSVLKQVNQGVSVARNNAIQVATGEYILPVDSDDKIGPTYIEHAVEVIHGHDQIRIVGCKGWKFGESDGEWKFPDYERAIMARRNIIPVTSLYRRSDWVTVGGYCEKEIFMEDWDFWLSLLELGGTYYRLDEIGIYYRIRTGSRWDTARQNKHQVIDALNERHPEFMKQYWGGPLHYHHHLSKWINLCYGETIIGTFSGWHRGIPVETTNCCQIRQIDDYVIEEYTFANIKDRLFATWKRSILKTYREKAGQAVAYRETRYMGIVRKCWLVYRKHTFPL